MIRLPAGAGPRRLLGIAPALGLIVAFMVLPMGLVAVYSALEPGLAGGVRPALSGEAWVRLLFQRSLGDDTLEFTTAYLAIFGRSIGLAVVATALSLALALPVALYMASLPPRRRTLLLLLVTVPFWTNLLIRTYCWILVLRDNGLANNALLALGVIDRPLTLLYTDGAVLLGLLYTYVPFMVLPIYASVERLDRRLIEAAHDLYADRPRMLRRIVLPLAAPGIVAGCILVFVPCLGAFVAPDLLGGGKKLMIGSLIQLQFSSSRNWPFGSAVALVLMALVLLALLLYARSPARRTLFEART